MQTRKSFLPIRLEPDHPESFARKGRAPTPWSERRSRVFFDHIGSKRNTSSDLPISRQLLGRRQTKTPVCQVGIKARQVYAVEDVEELEPQLEINLLGETVSLIEVKFSLE